MGRALCVVLSNKDIFVIVADINKIDGEAVVNDIINNGKKAKFALLNMTEANDIETLVSEVFHEFGRIDCMFNNAGIAMYGEIFGYSIYECLGRKYDRSSK
ncbi:hypothetical protein COL91_13820 [Bacillus pseudomycoides]|nr:hypothetical protein COO02_04045 [Bacillus pseudomycoides]PGA90579.1 hypothetical protein COL91_13820 [Bacillus pseudomycoides]PHF35744.1 hypothetical protein COF72_25080 [Bacillus pseudomycoides]